MRSNAGKATRSRTQHKSASSTKSKRSPVTSKSSVSDSSEPAAAQADSGMSGAVVQPSELENVLKDAFENTKDDRPNDAGCGKVNYFAEPDGQLNLLEIDTNELPEPIAYSDGKTLENTPKSISQFKVGDRIVCIEQGKDFNKHGSILQFTKSGSIFYEIDNSNISRICSVEQVNSILIKEELEICNQQSDNGNGSIFVQELGLDSPTPGLNVGDDRPISSANEMNIAGELSTSDSPAGQSPQTLNEVIGDSLTQQILSPPHHPVSHSQPKENVSEPKTIETVSQQSLLQLESYNQNLQLSKTSPDFSTALNDQEAISSTSPESLSIFPRAGTMQNGNVSGVQHFLLPGCEPESLLLRSPGALSSTGAGRPPGKNKLDYQLMNLGLLTNLEVTAPEFLEFSYNLPLGFSNPAETRTALELSQVQAQLSSNLELQAETEPTAIVESPLATPCIGQLRPSDSKELNISPALPALDNIGSFSKDDLLNFAITAHESIAGIERSELELAMRKLNQARIAGTCLTEFKKRCRHGEFGESVSTVINLRTAQTYMSIAENWSLLAEASRETLLVDGQTLGINWARDTIAQSKKSLKSAAAPANPDDWRTPNTKEQPIVNLVKQALGGQIWCDPCADAGHKVGAAVAYHKNEDGLKDINVWRKTVFINPPFSDPLPWVKKCCFSIARGDCSAAIMLMKAGTLSNQGTGNLIEKYASAVCHWRGRINFLNDEGVAVKGSDFDCVLVYFGDRLDLFKKAFEQRGTITTIQNRYSSVNNKHIAAATVPVVEEAQEVPAVPTAITSVKQEQELMQKELGLRTNGKTLLPDLSVNDRAKAEQLDPYNVDDRPFAIQVKSVEVEADDSKWYEETAIGVVSRTEGFTTNQSAEIINKLLKADFKSRTRATLKKLSKEELADLLRYCDQELDNRK